jgi:SulP family sulfate permease
VPSNEVTYLMPYGSVFFATAPLIEEELPSVTDETHNAVIILGLRGEEDLGSTFLEVLERYATDLHDHSSKLMLAGVGPLMRVQLDQTGIAQTIGRENIYKHTEKIGEAATLAWDAAQRWLAEQAEPSTSEASEQAEDQLSGQQGDS